MVLTKAILRNMQSLKEVVFEFPPTGLIVFTGENSNGKSIFCKVLKALITNEIKLPVKRASLVNRDALYGEAIYYRDDGVVLSLHLARQAKDTWVKFEAPEREPIVRYLADKNYMELVKAFGWHIDDKSGVSLNVAEVDSALLFYKTPTKVNGSILETARTDSSADKVLENFTITLKETKQLREQYVQQARTFQTALHELKVEDVDALTAKKEKLEYYYHNLSSVYLPELPEIRPVPKVTFVSPYIPSLPKVVYPVIVKIACNLPDITVVADELKSLREYRCPMCGRGF